MSTNVNNSEDRKSSENFVNPHFDLIRLWIQENIGKFVVILLIITYLATGFFIGLALQQGLTVFGVIISWIAGMSVAVVGQMIRGSLVYFSQANPYRLGGNAHIVGTAAALLLTIYAGYEVVHLLSEIGVSPAFQTSIVGLIIGGFFVEVFFLNELNKINQATIVNDPELFQMAIENEEKLAEVKIKGMEAKVKLTQARRARLRLALTEAKKTGRSTPSTPEENGEKIDPVSSPASRSFSNNLLDTIGNAYKLTSEQMNRIRTAMDQNESEEHIILMVDAFSLENKEVAQKKDAQAPLDVSLNGNGQH